jgi:hypothetical protein
MNEGGPGAAALGILLRYEHGDPATESEIVQVTVVTPTKAASLCDFEALRSTNSGQSQLMGVLVVLLDFPVLSQTFVLESDHRTHRPQIRCRCLGSWDAPGSDDAP